MMDYAKLDSIRDGQIDIQIILEEIRDLLKEKLK